jgi:hypothetical protein
VTSNANHYILSNREIEDFIKFKNYMKELHDFSGFMIKSTILKHFEEPLYVGVVRTERKVYMSCLNRTSYGCENISD